MDACGLRFRRPGPPISCPGRTICRQSQICAEAHVLGDTRTPVAPGLSAGWPFPAFTSVAALPSRGQGLHYFSERSTWDVVALHRTLNAAPGACKVVRTGGQTGRIGGPLSLPGAFYRKPSTLESNTDGSDSVSSRPKQIQARRSGQNSHSGSSTSKYVVLKRFRHQFRTQRVITHSLAASG
jgi:hypothetical protein